MTIDRRQIMDVQPGDEVRMRKPHPCGGYDWTVTRIGADIGLRCATCGRQVMLARAVFERRVKAIRRAGARTEQ